MNMPPRWGFSSFWGGGYIDVGSSGATKRQAIPFRDLDTARERMTTGRKGTRHEKDEL